MASSDIREFRVIVCNRLAGECEWLPSTPQAFQ